MFKLVVLSALFALATARPGFLAPTVYSSAVVGSIPTSVSHQSSSIVHSAALVSPVVHAAPVISTYAAPAVAAYASPAVAAYASPAVAAYASPALIGHGVYGGLHY
ncbi:hypothetical protein NQ314_006094 [Rhamnusium bicolor]|uniref:Uncharacterized protein n=1 Tax=Rhamnusium bicolor TaxID=1586634 RepID=A0AAV8ZAZ4_9CUCU|nr:hypothetical protein NQ314_006094 [Rhamnusium bicolor]